jgi:hypothetical protein
MNSESKRLDDSLIVNEPAAEINPAEGFSFGQACLTGSQGLC